MLILTASFEGKPADNARHFVEWLENVKGTDALAGVSFGVFGCGNRDWVQTYQRIPTLVDRVLEEHGATRLVERGEGDAASAGFFEAFDQWEKGMWEKLAKVCAPCERASQDRSLRPTAAVRPRWTHKSERLGREDGINGNVACGAPPPA